MTLKVAPISREISIGKETAIKDGLAPELLTSQGWKLREKSWTKSVPVVQFYEAEHERNGPPDVGTPGLDDILAGIRKACETLEIPPDLLVKAMNNGLYLEANARSKPKALNSVAGLEIAFFTSNPSPADVASYMAATVAGSKETYLREWYAKKNAPAAA